jgi:NifU-like protein involved in Fe-S cluster formation
MDPRFLDHFNHPRNAGTLDDAHGTASAENPVCGDRIRIDLRLDRARIEALRFEVLGCSGAIASASAMSELVLGLTVEEARALERDAIDAALGGLPTLKRHGADLAIDGLRAALEAATRSGPAEPK